MNDSWSENYWDEYIREKFSKKENPKNLTIVEFYKIYDYPRNVFWGHTNDDRIVKVTYWKESNKSYFGFGCDETYYGADDMNMFQLYRDDINDDVLLEILKGEFKWNIINYFDFCE
tara:strand:+ start:3818 stop:4165 length:348 start_codon:yes stop_codon:yes gene_type:complete